MRIAPRPLDLRVHFDGRLKLKFLDSQVTTDAGLLAYREPDETLRGQGRGQENEKNQRARRGEGVAC